MKPAHSTIARRLLVMVGLLALMYLGVSVNEQNRASLVAAQAPQPPTAQEIYLPVVAIHIQTSTPTPTWTPTTTVTPTRTPTPTESSTSTWTPTSTPTPTNTPPSGSGDMVTVPAGTFQMGCDPAHNGGYQCLSHELPLHTVYLLSLIHIFHENHRIVGIYQVVVVELTSR